MTTLGTVAVVAVTAPPARAHGDEGVAEVLVAEADADGRLYVEVGVLYANDDDLATGATVTATVTGADGGQVGPVPLPRLDDARYATTVTPAGPGPWTVVVESTQPSARAEATVAPPTTGPTTTGPTTTGPTTTGPTTTGPTATARAGGSGDGGESTLVARLVVGALATMAAAGCIVGGIWWGRRRSGSTGPGGRG